MLANKSGSYYEEYRRSKAREKSPLEDERLLTDRAAYLSFLEVQLERVSSACLVSQSFGDRIEEVQASVLSFEERINNLARAVKLTESSGQDVNKTTTRKLDDLQNDVAQIETKIEQTHRGLGNLRAETETFEQRQKDLTEVLRRRLEEKVLDMSSRLELEEARSKTNETRIVSLGDMARAESKAAAETLQSKLELRVEALREQLDLRVSSLETRVTNGLEHFKSFEAAEAGGFGLRPVLEDADNNIGKGRGGKNNTSRVKFAQNSPEQVSSLRAEVERVRQESIQYTDTTTTRLEETIQTLERKLGELNGPSASTQTVARLVRRIDEMELRQETLEQDNTHLREQVSSLRQELRRNGIRTSSTLAENSSHVPVGANEDYSPGTAVASEGEQDRVDHSLSHPLSRQEVKEMIQRAVADLNKNLRNVLEAVERKLSEQSRLVTDSMNTVENFMDIFDAAQEGMAQRVRRGRIQEKRLRAMLQETTEALESEHEPARLGTESKHGPSRYELAMRSLNLYDHEDEEEDENIGDHPPPRTTRRVSSRRENSKLKKNGSSKSKVASAASTSRSSHRTTRVPSRQHTMISRHRTKSVGSDSETGYLGHQVDTISSLRRRRSKTPPPFIVREKSDDDGNFTDSSNSRRFDGGGKRGREQPARTSSIDFMETQDPSNAEGPAEQLRATDGRRDARASEIAAAAHKPAWNAAAPLPPRSRHSSR
mmetsp:Transcript_9986/g.19599  ORF Transcript_9986/g.19599 Transcript_9986/m.19599 type:complete len:715 (-) Transcript_9986:68-2212(-)